MYIYTVLVRAYTSVVGLGYGERAGEALTDPFAGAAPAGRLRHFRTE